MTRVSILQLDAARSVTEPTLPRLVAGLDRAAGEGSALLVAPELATTGYGAGRRLADLAEPATGPTLARLADAVARTGVALVTGFAERDGDRVYNAAAALLPGRAPVVYRKAQLYGFYEREHFAVAPLESRTFEIDGLKVGLLICFDVEFPEHVRRLARAGCDLVAVPTALPGTAASVFVAERVVPVRAFENQVFVAYAGWAGADAAFEYAGRSCLAAPDGADLLRAPAAGEYLGTADVRPADYEESRTINPYLAEFRSS